MKKTGGCSQPYHIKTAQRFRAKPYNADIRP